MPASSRRFANGAAWKAPHLAALETDICRDDLPVEIEMDACRAR
jgi:hypothetical protein